MARQILLYFGSFNPIHNGHLHIATQALNCLGMAKLWFVLSPQNPQKSVQDLLASAERLKMLELALADYPELEICTLELSLPLPSYTYLTLRSLRARYPQTEFALLMGSDNFANLNSWRNAQEIKNLHKIYICTRAGSPSEFPLPPNCYLLPMHPIDISATQLRAAIRAKRAIHTLVPAKVADYIAKHALYQ